MPSYISNFEHMETNQKEVIFQSILKAQLLLKEFVVAIPEPDIGDDIWITDLRGEDYIIYPAQIKSAYAHQPLKKGNVKRYIINIKYHKLKSTLERKYIYFFGLYDPDFGPNKFHIGCIPSTFFLDHWDFLNKKKVAQDKYTKRVNLNIDYYVSEDEYYIFGKPLVPISMYFNNFSAIA